MLYIFGGIHHSFSACISVHHAFYLFFTDVVQKLFQPQTIQVCVLSIYFITTEYFSHLFIHKLFDLFLFLIDDAGHSFVF